MYRSTTYPVNNYVPTKVTEIHDLHSRLNKMKYDEIIENFDYHFKNCFVTNFDIIHHQCRGDKLNFSREHYETVFYNRLKENLNEQNQEKFIASAIRSERKDINFEKKVISEHFNKVEIEKKLEENGVFLSAMKKKFYFKKTDDCKSIKL